MTKDKIPAISSGPFTATPTGLVVSGDVPYELWAAYGEGLQRVGAAIQWIIGDWLNYGEKKYGEMYSQAVEITGLKGGTLRSMKWVAANVQMSLRRDNLAWFHHKEIASLEPEYQRRWLKCAENREWPVRELRRRVQLWKRDKGRVRKLEEMTALETFNIIYADPPWQYDYSFSESRAIERHYETMPLEEILVLPVDEISADDSLLFLWCPPAFLKKGLLVMETWDFDYRTSMIWVKPSIGPGQWVRQRHEYLLIGRKGEWPTADGSLRPDSVIEARRGAHSEKPDVFYEIIEKMYPNAHRVELFSRSKRAGWESWGNEVG